MRQLTNSMKAIATLTSARTWGLSLCALLASLALASPALAAPDTTVTFTFDDGRPSQIAAGQELANRGLSATYFIITSQVGRTGVMSVADLNALKAQGHEIGAHTVMHRSLPTLTTDEAMREVCLSRGWLMDRGFDVYDMAYPYDATNSSVKASVAACGYDAARAGGQLLCDEFHDCAETIPPSDPYALKTPLDFNSSTSLADMKEAVTNAENTGGGWVPLEIHDVCDGPGDPLLPAGATCGLPYAITRSLYTQFLTWLQGEIDAGRVQVKTVHEVVGGPLQPKVTVAPAPVRTGNLLVNPSFETASTSGAPADCFANVNNGPSTPPIIASTSDAHEGSKGIAITMPAGYDSWAYNALMPELDLARCSPTAIPGHHYTFTGWYKGSGSIKVFSYWRNADNSWARVSTGPTGTATFPSAAGWTKATFTFVAPAGATAVSAGFAIDGSISHPTGNSYVVDDTSLTDADVMAPVFVTLSAAKAGTGSGTVTSNPAGISCGSTCQFDFEQNASVTLTAAAASGSGFTGWSGACTGTAPTCVVAMSAAKTATATFAPLVHLTVAKAGTGNGSVTSSPAAIDCGATCGADLASGTSVTLTAAPASDSTFTGWSGACSGASTTCVLSMTVARSATATFAIKPSLTVVKTGTGSGSVTSSPAGIDCGSTCQLAVANGTSVTLTATPAVNSTFTGWTGACSGSSATCVLAMTVDRSATAIFTAKTTLTVVKAGTGSGSVTSSPAGIDCGSTCQASLTYGTSVTLTATPASDSTFTGWTGACTGSSVTCVLPMTADRSATATFTVKAALSVATAGTGTGSVTSPAGIDCGSTCQVSLPNGTSATLTANAAAGSTFTGWSGACTGTAPTCVLSMTADRSATATFMPEAGLSVAKAGNGSGSVTSAPAAVDCGSTCQANVAYGTSVTLTAAPVAGSTFTGWSGACTGTAATCVLAMTADRAATATFTLKVTLMVAKTGAGSGSVTSSPAAIDCGATCAASVADGTSVTLTAAPAASSTFTGWTGACTGTATTCVLSMTSDRTATATFTAKAALTVVKAGTGNGSVTSSPAAIDCGATCAASVANGTSVTLTAAPAANSTFTGWTGACAGTATTCVLSMTADRSATATFTLKAALTVARAGSGNGSVTSSPAAIDCGSTCAASLTNGTSVTLTATPASDSTFTGWSGACTGSATTCVLSMTADRSATATFTLKASLTIVNAGTGHGSVTSSPAAIDCGSTCAASFTSGTSVTLTAAVSSDSTFTGWTGACAGTSPTCVLSMTTNRTATATFTLKASLTVVRTGTGSGSVTSSPAAIDCGSTCAASLTNGTSVTLTATPASDSTFTGWTGACTGTTATCVLSMTSDRTATATFTEKAVLAVAIGGSGNGSVTSNPAAIDCGSTCEASLTNGTVITLTAAAAPGSTFIGWRGACTGTSLTCALTMTADRSAIASFTTDPVLTVRKDGSGAGTVTANPAGIACDATCAEQNAGYTPGTSVTLTATAADGSVFTGWSEASCAGTGTCTVALDVARTVTATFTAVPPVAAAPDDAGVVVTPPVVVAPVVQTPAPVAPVVDANAAKVRPTVHAKPKISGRARAGQALVCNRGQWDGRADRYAFTWLRDGKVVGHGQRYSVKKADRGHNLRCDVTASNAKGSTTAKSATVRVAR